MFCEPIPIVTKHIYRIVFPTSFHRTISNLIHATTITRHIEDYKTLRLRLCVLIFTTGLKKYSHCMLIYRWRQREQ